MSNSYRVRLSRVVRDPLQNATLRQEKNAMSTLGGPTSIVLSLVLSTLAACSTTPAQADGKSSQTGASQAPTGTSPTQQSIYQQSGAAFSTGYTAANDALSKTVASIATTLRVQYVQDRFVSPAGTSYPKISDATIAAFGQYVCAGENALGPQRSAMTVLSAYQAHIKDLTTAPTASISAIWNDIKKSSAPAQPLALKEIATNNDCLDEVSFLATKTTGETGEVGTAGIFSLYSAISALIKGIDNVVVAIGTIIDDSVRAKALAKYVSDNRQLIDGLLDNQLNTPDPTIQAMCGGVVTAPCKSFSPAQPPNVIDGALLRSKWASLRLPLYSFNELNNSAGSLVKSNHFAEIFVIARRMDGDISTFNTLRNQPSPANIVAAMKKAQSDLENLAAGKLTTQEAYSALEAFAIQMTSIASSISTVATNYTAVATAAEKVK
jgi:hypothetical protein